jgi:hypothetical protein
MVVAGMGREFGGERVLAAAVHDTIGSPQEGVCQRTGEQSAQRSTEMALRRENADHTDRRSHLPSQ